jgi:hypothetical protein
LILIGSWTLSLAFVELCLCPFDLKSGIFSTELASPTCNKILTYLLAGHKINQQIVNVASLWNAHSHILMQRPTRKLFEKQISTFLEDDENGMLQKNVL